VLNQELFANLGYDLVIGHSVQAKAAIGVSSPRITQWQFFLERDAHLANDRRCHLYGRLVLSSGCGCAALWTVVLFSTWLSYFSIPFLTKNQY
jgi:hypothetical protein